MVMRERSRAGAALGSRGRVKTLRAVLARPPAPRRRSFDEDVVAMGPRGFFTAWGVCFDEANCYSCSPPGRASARLRRRSGKVGLSSPPPCGRRRVAASVAAKMRF
eukprot:30861-Pelagococcus_subviridis.AAC.7